MMQYEWQPIETAPKKGRIDIWAKRWDCHKDVFDCQRFADCIWWDRDSFSNTPSHWSGVMEGWRATHWMPLPAPPRAIAADDGRRVVGDGVS